MCRRNNWKDIKNTPWEMVDLLVREKLPKDGIISGDAARPQQVELAAIKEHLEHAFREQQNNNGTATNRHHYVCIYSTCALYTLS